MDNKEKETFNYTYSAKQQEEIKAIRSKYTKEASSEDKLTQLKHLDASVAKKAAVISVTLGIIGALIMGMGMSLAMSELSALFGAYEHLAMPVGIVIGIIGIALISLAYPVYNRVLKKERERIAPEILRLSDELMK